DVHVAVPGADSKFAAQKFHGHALSESFLKTPYALYKIIRNEKPDLVHAITLKSAFAAGLALLFCRNVQAVYTIAGLGYLFSGEGIKPKLLRFLLSPFFKIVFCNKRTKLVFQNSDDRGVFLKRGFAKSGQCF